MGEPGSCELCGRPPPFAPFYPRHKIVACEGCGLVFYGETVEASPLYDESYFKGGEYLDYVAEKRVATWNFERRLVELDGLLPKGRLLEIGCAYGFFLEVARGKWEARGIDVVSAGIEHARAQGLDATRAEFLDLEDEPSSYDVVCLWDTIEHLARPVRVIEKAARWLRPGGALVMTTGDLGSRVARWRGDRWRLVHPPTHLYYFSRETLGKAVQRAGLEVADVRHVGYYRSSSMMLYRMFALGGGPLSFLHSLGTLGGRLDVPIYLDLHDIMMLVARKPL